MEFFVEVSVVGGGSGLGEMFGFCCFSCCFFGEDLEINDEMWKSISGLFASYCSTVFCSENWSVPNHHLHAKWPICKGLASQDLIWPVIICHRLQQANGCSFPPPLSSSAFLRHTGRPWKVLSQVSLCQQHLSHHPYYSPKMCRSVWKTANPIQVKKIYSIKRSEQVIVHIQGHSKVWSGHCGSRVSIFLALRFVCSTLSVCNIPPGLECMDWWQLMLADPQH